MYLPLKCYIKWCRNGCFQLEHDCIWNLFNINGKKILYLYVKPVLFHNYWFVVIHAAHSCEFMLFRCLGFWTLIIDSKGDGMLIGRSKLFLQDGNYSLQKNIELKLEYTFRSIRVREKNMVVLTQYTSHHTMTTVCALVYFNSFLCLFLIKPCFTFFHIHVTTPLVIPMAPLLLGWLSRVLQESLGHKILFGVLVLSL